MNQHRWTFTTIVVLTAVLAPIANVYAQISPLAASAANRSLQSSLPIITPLTVTEIETDVAIPTVTTFESPEREIDLVNQPATVPSRSVASRTSIATSPTKTPIASLNRRLASAPAQPTQVQLPKQLSSTKLAARTSTFITEALQSKHSGHRSTAPVFIFDNPTAPFVAKSGEITTPQIASVILPSAVPVTTPSQQPQSFTVKAVSQPLLVRRNAAGVTTKIINTATIQAEIARLPQAAPSISQTEDTPENLGFIAGTPTFVFESDLRPQQIIATAIAQVGNTSIAAEPSIAIPVQTPKQSTLPTIGSPTPAEFEPNPAQQPTENIQPPQPQIVAIQTGQASWYGREGGPMTANGEQYNPNGLTAAHRTLPFGTKVRVISLKTGKSTIVRINDRGPFRSRRIIDVSAGAAAAIGIKNDGIGDVRVEILKGEG
jgi:rare lipoprotein A